MSENYDFIELPPSQSKEKFLGNDSTGSNWFFTWTLYDLPYPIPNTELLGKLEKDKLDELIKLASFSQIDVIIEQIRGHASAEGQPPRNYDLAESRAESVRAYLLTNTPSTLGGFITDTTPIQSFGEDIPEIKFGQKDHPLNRRVEIDLLVHYKSNISTPISSTDKGKNWQIDYQVSFSFYKSLGFQFGFGSLELLDENNSSRTSPIKKDFAYAAIGGGMKVDNIMGKASGLIPIGTRKKILLIQQRVIGNAKRMATSGLPEWLLDSVKDILNGIKKLYRDIESSSKFRNGTPEEKSMYVLTALGVMGSIPKTNFFNLEGKFITNNKHSFKGMQNSIQFITGVNVFLKVGIGVNFQLTIVPIFINGQDAEWVFPINSGTSVDTGSISAGAEISINISRFWFRE